MQNVDVAALFTELADLLEIQGANPFRVRAYRNAARTIENLSESVAGIVADPDHDLSTLEGIGKDLAEKIETIVKTGQLPQLEEQRAEIPADVREMLRIPGLGPKKVAALFHELNIRTLGDLRVAAESGKVAELKGFGKKTAQTILEGLALLEEVGKRVYLAVAKPAADVLVADLLASGTVEEASVAGSCRRRKESCGDLDLLAVASDSKGAMDCLAGHPLVTKVMARGETKQRVRLHSGLELDLRVVPAESYGAALQYFTGSKEHNIVVRRRAQERGLKVNEYGVFRGEESIAGRTEEEVYAAVDLPWIPPELRENRGEIELAEQHKLPKLLELSDMRGDLHMHTTATDGTATIEEMVEAARARGLEYIAITDHSKRVTMANGLDADRLREHWRNIDAVRKKTKGIHVLCGIECDILEDATMDLPDDVLAEADWVLAVLHYGLKQPRAKIQERLMMALRNPYVHAIGHPTGRILGQRPGADIDFDELFHVAKEEGKFLEINADPARLDLDDVHAAAAMARGIPIVISTDAHSTKGFASMEWGVYQARRAGLTADDVINTLPWKEFSKRIQR